jgi:hypothetical protein
VSPTLLRILMQRRRCLEADPSASLEHGPIAGAGDEPVALVELDTWHDDGYTVALEWHREAGQTQILVGDSRTASQLVFDVPPANAGDLFRRSPLPWRRGPTVDTQRHRTIGRPMSAAVVKQRVFVASEHRQAASSPAPPEDLSDLHPRLLRCFVAVAEELRFFPRRGPSLHPPTLAFENDPPTRAPGGRADAPAQHPIGPSHTGGAPVAASSPRCP